MGRKASLFPIVVVGPWVSSLTSKVSVSQEGRFLTRSSSVLNPGPRQAKWERYRLLRAVLGLCPWGQNGCSKILGLACILSDEPRVAEPMPHEASEDRHFHAVHWEEGGQ